MIVSVISGDVINSRKVKAKIWQTALKKVLSSYGKETKDWELFRGDSFQIELVPAHNALRAALHIKSAMKSMKSLDVRMAIGIGVASKRGPNTKVTETYGEAFIFSGQLLETLKKKSNLAIKSPIPGFDEAWNLYFDLALLTMNNWSPSSAEVVRISIERPEATQSELAKIVGITQGRVSDRQKRAGYDEIMRMEYRFNQMVGTFTKT